MILALRTHICLSRLLALIFSSCFNFGETHILTASPIHLCGTALQHMLHISSGLVGQDMRHLDKIEVFGLVWLCMNQYSGTFLPVSDGVCLLGATLRSICCHRKWRKTKKSHGLRLHQQTV